MRAIGVAVTVFSAVVIALATLIPSSQRISSTRWCVVCGDVGGVDVTLNLLLFVPLGVGLALAGIRAKRAIPLMCLSTAMIETLQHFVVHGRDASLSDLMSNSTGGALGFVIGCHIITLFRPSARVGYRLAAAWICGWTAWQAIAAYALTRQPTVDAYYGQIRRQLGGLDLFPGSVLWLTVDGVPVPNTRLPDAERTRERLMSPEGALVDATVIAWRPTRRIAPILRMADSGEHEIVLAAQQRTDFVYGMRTGAARLRLRTMLYSLPGALTRPDPAAPFGEHVVRVTGRRGQRDVELTAERNGQTVRERYLLSPSQGWRLLTPWQTRAMSAQMEQRAAALWLLLFLMPAGYWLGVAVMADRRLDRVAFIAATVPVSLSAVPLVFDLYQPSWSEVTGALVGMLIGMALARIVSVSLSSAPTLVDANVRS